MSNCASVFIWPWENRNHGENAHLVRTSRMWVLPSRCVEHSGSDLFPNMFMPQIQVAQGSIPTPTPTLCALRRAETMVNMISATKTKQGLRVKAVLDRRALCDRSKDQQGADEGTKPSAVPCRTRVSIR